MSMVVCSDQQVLAIIGKFQASPPSTSGRRRIAFFVWRKIETGEGSFVVVAEVVEKD